MKKLFALLLAAALLFCLAACAKTGDPADGTTTEAAPVSELTEAATEAPAPTGDAAHINEIKTQLIGSWHFYAYDGVKLTFRDNGTGSYLGLDGSERSFLYLVTVTRGEIQDISAAYEYDMLKVEFDNGASENIVIDFREENGTKLILHSFEEDGYSGGYSGVIEFDDWTKDD